ncbi:hypothetical protein DFP72DRAFT_903028 [Ephemerocybe angulata]|uniref:Uncharacterized protein n=1 Tax=Ephemerocybe angulata TaxID=980116 RepID=A0A8H6HWB5_9AGAR|nr:hypothetical protein DFP72DRAFT_903028 [Tulosesus angulatus]
MFWGWAQTDPAGIHASSAPGHGRWARTPRPCSGAGRKLTLRGFTHPQLQYMDAGPEHHVHVLGLGCVLAAAPVSTTLISRPTAQTDPAGIHASSAPVHGRWAPRISTHPNANPNAFRSTMSVCWGWAQTDPAGIHASSAPGHGRPRRPDTPWHPGMGSHLPFPWMHWC